MALLMTVFFENGFSENYFPNVDNRNFPIAIRPYVSGLKEELVLNAESGTDNGNCEDPHSIP